LNPLKAQPQYARQRVAQGGLAHTGQILDQQMTSAQQTGHGQTHLRLLAQHHFIDCVQTRIQFSAHRKASPGDCSWLVGLQQMPDVLPL